MILLLVALASAGTWPDVARPRLLPEGAGWVAPSPEERAAYVALVRDLAIAAPSGTFPAGLAARAAALGLALDVAGTTATLREDGDRLRGVGVVAVRAGPLPAELVLQAPHPVSDVGTGAIAGALFDAGEVRAVCLATVHRRAGDGSDPARAADGWLQAATLGLAEALPDPLFVQVHGFAGETTEADAVVSEGASRMPAADLEAAVRRLRVGLGATDVRTGADVPALAARYNAQSRLLADRARFLHVEMSEPLRTALKDDDARRAALHDALLLLAARETGVPR